jgi:hypothetical protein
MSVTVGGRKLVHVATWSGTTTGGDARPSYNHESSAGRCRITPTLSRQWILRTPDQSEGIFDSLEEVVAAIDAYEREHPAP